MCEPMYGEDATRHLYEDSSSTSLYPALPPKDDSVTSLHVSTSTAPPSSTCVHNRTVSSGKTKATFTLEVMSLAGAHLGGESCTVEDLSLPASEIKQAVRTSSQRSQHPMLLFSKEDLDGFCEPHVGPSVVFTYLIYCRVSEQGGEGGDSSALIVTPTMLNVALDDSANILEGVLKAYREWRGGAEFAITAATDEQNSTLSRTQRRATSDEASSSLLRRSRFYEKESAREGNQPPPSGLVLGDESCAASSTSTTPTLQLSRDVSAYDTAADVREVLLEVTIVPSVFQQLDPTPSGNFAGCCSLPTAAEVHISCPRVDENPLSTGFTRRAFSAMIRRARKSTLERQPEVAVFADSAHEEEPPVQRSCLGIAENLQRHGTQLLMELQALHNTLVQGASLDSVGGGSSQSSSIQELQQQAVSSIRQSPMEAKVSLVQLCLISIEEAVTEPIARVKRDLNTLVEVVSCSSSVALEALSVTDGNMENALNMMLSNPSLASQSAEQLARFAIRLFGMDKVAAVCDERYLKGSNHNRRVVRSNPPSESSKTNRSRVVRPATAPPNPLESCRDALLEAGHHTNIVAPLTRNANGNLSVCRAALSGDLSAQRAMSVKSEEVGWYGLFIQQLVGKWSNPNGHSSPPRAGQPMASSAIAPVDPYHVLKEASFPQTTTTGGSMSPNASTSPPNSSQQQHQQLGSHSSSSPPSYGTGATTQAPSSSRMSSRTPTVRGGPGGLGSWGDYPDTNLDAVLEALGHAKEFVRRVTSQAEDVSALWHSPTHHAIVKCACQAFVDYIVASTHTPRRVPVSSSSHTVTSSSSHSSGQHPPPSATLSFSSVPSSRGGPQQTPLQSQPPSTTSIPNSNTTHFHHQPPPLPHQEQPTPLLTRPTPHHQEHQQPPHQQQGSSPHHSVSNRINTRSPVHQRMSTGSPPSVSSASNRPSQSGPPPLPSQPPSPSGSISNRMSFSSLNGLISRSSTPLDNMMVSTSPPTTGAPGSLLRGGGMPAETWGSTGNLSASHRFTVPRNAAPPALPGSPPSE